MPHICNRRRQCVRRSDAAGRTAFIGLLATFFVVLIGLATPTAAWAHAMNVFATVEDQMIRGRAYYRGQMPAAQATVKLFDDQGTLLDSTITNDLGEFKLPVTFRGLCRLTVETSDGHGAETEFATDAPSGGAFPIFGSADDPAAGTQSGDSAGTAADHTGGSASPDTAAISPAAIEELRKSMQEIEWQVVALREELQNQAGGIRFRDIVGGIGYIVGLVGVAFYFAARRKQFDPREMFGRARLR